MGEGIYLIMTRVMPTTKAYKIFAISDIFDIYT